MKEMQQKIQEVIENGRNFLIISHRNVDGDAYGSSMAFYFYLKSLGKTAEAINDTPITPLFYFLDIHNIITKEIVEDAFDAIFVFDCGELSMSGKYHEKYKELFERVPMINMDHHIGNPMFGKYNIVDGAASSACEVLFDFLEQTGGTITPFMATLLLFGIIRDTNLFKNSIRPRTFEITGKLLSLGAEYERIIFHSYKSERLNYLRLYGNILENLISLKGGTIVGGIITQETFKKYGIHENELGPQFINEFLSSIDGADFAFLIKETEAGERKLSLRARRDGFDISKIAQRFGGGGHKQSSGAYTTESIEEILKVVEEMDVRE